MTERKARAWRTTKFSGHWAPAAHFVSWLGLCPENEISGGRVLWRAASATPSIAPVSCFDWLPWDYTTTRRR